MELRETIIKPSRALRLECSSQLWPVARRPGEGVPLGIVLGRRLAQLLLIYLFTRLPLFIATCGHAVEATADK